MPIPLVGFRIFDKRPVHFVVLKTHDESRETENGQLDSQLIRVDNSRLASPPQYQIREGRSDTRTPSGI